MTTASAEEGQGAVQISFVVPSYEMAPYLELTLASLRQLRDEACGGFEVVVVDDGSSDDTPGVAARAEAGLPELRYVRRERDDRSCRALARNLGARASRGRQLLFLDAGVMVRSDFLDAVATAWAEAPDDVLVISTLGLFVWQTGEDTRRLLSGFRSLDPEELAAAMAVLEREPAWCERRRPLFDSTGGDLSRLPAPWLFAWTSALGVPRARFDAVGGFDESFLSWGGEDCDLGLALHQSGCRFRAFANQSALHLPHPTEPPQVKQALNLANARKIHAKRPGRDSELFAALGDPFAANRLALLLDDEPLWHLLPDWDHATLEAAGQLLEGAPRALIVAAPTPDVVARFPRATFLVPSRPLHRRLVAAAGEEGKVRCAVGCHSGEAASACDVVILTDLIRLLPIPLQAAQFAEATRVGRRAFLLCSTREPAESVRWPLARIETLAGAAARAGITLRDLAIPTSGARAFALGPPAASAR